MTLCAYDLSHDCVSDCAAALVVPDAEKEGATRIVCSRLVRETANGCASAKSSDVVDETPAPAAASPTNVLLYR
jgi:hypothetical protein